jgi:circadian clock protein KaiC
MLCDRIVDEHCTALLIDAQDEGSRAIVADTLVGGVICLDQLSPTYGGERRRLSVRKMRASRTVGGYHDFAIRDRGVEVYPRLVAAAHRAAHSSAALPSGVGELDSLLGGGLDGGTSTILMGPAGT